MSTLTAVFDGLSVWFGNGRECGGEEKGGQAMVIAIGVHLVRTDGTGQRKIMQVKVVRHSPVPYAEIEPIGGGRRVAVLLTELARDFRPASDVLSAEQMAHEILGSEKNMAGQ
ncbi:hypothetical protein [Nocardia sp. NPDC057440]|uniref:hypothetical protein n=1 Tax=Nocardia sp. NPDC057440 TaxID=3346134 RepID=UPI003670BE71